MMRRPPYPWEPEADGAEAFAWLAILLSVVLVVVVSIGAYVHLP